MKKEIKSILETIGQALVGAVTDKTLLAEKDLLKQRLAVCDNCENLERHNFACKKCGCRVIYKARIKKTKCPIGKW